MKNESVNPRYAIAALAAVATFSACSPADRSPSQPIEMASQEPAATLPARWWLWVESTGARNPVSDANGRDCAVKQPADVWFLAGTYGGTAKRTCTITGGRPIYFPVMNLICEADGGGTTEDALEDCDPRPQNMSAHLDGKALKIVRATSEGAFTFMPGPASMVSSTSEPFEAVAGGAWVGPMDLTAGDHVLRFEAASADFELDVTYHLTVK